MIMEKRDLNRGSSKWCVLKLNQYTGEVENMIILCHFQMTEIDKILG